MESISITVHNFYDFYTSKFLEGKGKRWKTAFALSCIIEIVCSSGPS